MSPRRSARFGSYAHGCRWNERSCVPPSRDRGGPSRRASRYGSAVRMRPLWRLLQRVRKHATQRFGSCESGPAVVTEWSAGVPRRAWRWFQGRHFVGPMNTQRLTPLRVEPHRPDTHADRPTIKGQKFPRVVPSTALQPFARHGIPIRSASAFSPTTFDRNGVRVLLSAGWWAPDRRMSSGVERISDSPCRTRHSRGRRRTKGRATRASGKRSSPSRSCDPSRGRGGGLQAARFSKRPARFVLPKAPAGTGQLVPG